jgi:hypothetical protein
MLMKRHVLIAIALTAALPLSGHSQELARVERPPRLSFISGLDEGPISRHLLYAVTATDFALTRVALSQGARELNPALGQHWGRQAAVMTGATIGVELMATHLERRGEKQKASLVRWITIGAHGFAIAWNLRVIHQ